MEWLESVYGGNVGLSCFCFRLHIFSNETIVLQPKLYKPVGFLKYQVPQIFGGLTFYAMVRRPADVLVVLLVD